MTTLIALEAFELVPAVELEPGTFATQEHRLPAVTSHDVPEEWTQYWLDCLADSGVVGLTSMWPASWLVTTRQLTDGLVLGRILSTIVREWGGPAAFSDPESRPVLNGGLALFCCGEVLVAPTCCGDLGNVSEWRDAVAYRQPDWRIIWVGHPWVSVRFDEGRLVFSEPHESSTHNARWAVRPEDLGRAVAAAEAELEAFALRLRPALSDLGVADAGMVARKLAGLAG